MLAEKAARPALREEIEEEVTALFRLEGEGATELLLVRHAQPASDLGPADDPLLSCAGLEQTERLAQRLRWTGFEAVYTAPERRAVQTARVIAAAREKPLYVMEALRDVPFTPSACRHGPPVGLPALFLAEPRWDTLPGFGGSQPFRRRVFQAIDAIIAAETGRRVVVVTHASVINAYLSALLGIQRDLFFAPDYASITVLRSLGDLYALRRLNDIAHLEGLAH